ncbi:MAG TPA: PhzF family isomerase [Candidatus Bathyarchaeia archaeon]|nr:PhzF family isomerase [Candidatus Bathyarchaeia archaeon]
MTRKYRLYQIDSFTKEKFTGNPAGVITNADGLTENEMMKIARELNNSETAFIFSSSDPAYDVHVRFFTPTIEVPICGHATIAAHYARAVEQQLDTTRVIQKTGAGILPVEIIREADDYRIIMTQGKIEFGAVIEGENREILLDALHITEGDIMADCPIQVVSTGHSKVMIGLNSSSVLHQLKPNYQALAQLSQRIMCNGYYTFTLDSAEDDILANGRMFAPAIGINEDPVTGNANGPLGAYLVHHKLARHHGAFFRFKAKQGEAIERSGTIEVDVQIEKGEPVEVSISGNAVIVFQSELIL